MKDEVGFYPLVLQRVRESTRVKEAFLKDKSALRALSGAARRIVESLRAGGKVMLFGNGGSAADAQHIAAELVGRYGRERAALAAIALTVNTSALTALGNDYGFDAVFARQVDALGRKGDVAIALSTSGNSPNVLRGVRRARAQGIVTVGLTGKDGGKLKSLVEYCICAPSTQTPRIQETHILLGHILCEIVEREL